MKTPLIEKLTDMKRKSGMSFEKLGDVTGISASTINRWFNNQGVPDLEEIERLCDAMGGKIEDIFITVGKQEMTATQDIGYQGAKAMVEHYEARLQAKDDQQKQFQEHHKQAIEHRDKVVQYLKDQVDAMQRERERNRDELDKQRNRADDLDRKRHNVFWGMLVVIILLLVMMGIMIVVDAPGIGMGWN